MLSRARPVLLTWLLLATVAASLILRATYAAPKGTAFVGTFYFVDDFYHYLDNVEQAQRGVLVFKSKLVSPDAPSSLVNIEWLAVGWLAALLGGRGVLAYRLFGFAALAALVGLADHWLVRAGLPERHRLAGLLLVFTGGGLGGLLVTLRVLPSDRAFDLRTGAYPFVEMLANPHFVAGTALLAGALLAFAAGRHVLGALIGVALGFVRPYDAALLLSIEAVALPVEAGLRGLRDRRRLACLAALPVPLIYNAWVVREGAGFRAFASPVYGSLQPTPLELLIAFGPACVLALNAVVAWRRGDHAQRAHLLRLGLWAVLAISVVVLRPVPFSLQFLVGLGLPMLALAAVGLAHLRPRLSEACIPLMASTALVVVSLCATPNADTHPPIERLRVAEALRSLCRPGDLALTPPDIGLYVGGLTSCWPFVSHATATDYQERVQVLHGFYEPRTSPAARARFLDRAAIAHVMLPTDSSASWLGTGSAFRPALLVAGPNGSLAIWSRSQPPPGVAAPP